MHVPAETEHGSAFYLLFAGAVEVQRERMKEGTRIRLLRTSAPRFSTRIFLFLCFSTSGAARWCRRVQVEKRRAIIKYVR